MYAFDGLHLYEDTIRAFLIGRYLDDGLDSIPDQRGVGVVLNSCFIHVDGDDRGMERETLREWSGETPYEGEVAFKGHT